MPSNAEVQERAAVIRSLCEQTYQKYGLTPAGIDALITNNFHLGAIRSLCALAEQNSAKAFTGTVGEYGHVYASDVIINLASLLAAKSMAEGTKIMLLATGSYTFASAIITATGRQSGPSVQKCSSSRRP